MVEKTYLQVWDEYNSLEDEFKNIIKYIPLEEEHLDVWSLKLGDILIVLGSAIESFFKFAIKDSIFDSTAKIENIRRKKETNIKDYSKVFEDYYDLSKKYVYIRSMGKFIRPFEQWAYNKPLEWWRAYQDVKHDRFVNKKEAKLKYVLEGIAGLFLLSVVHIPIRLILLRLGFLQSEYNDSWNVDFLESSVLNQKEPIKQHEIFLCKTDMFGYILEAISPDTKDHGIWQKLLAIVRKSRF